MNFRHLLIVCYIALLPVAALAQSGFDKEQYIANFLEVLEVEATYIDTYSNKHVPAIRYSIKNHGEQTLTKVEVTVYFLDAEGLPFSEETYLPVFVSSYSSNNRTPLRPNYTYRMESNKWMTNPRLGDEWSGEIEIVISDIEIAE